MKREHGNERWELSFSLNYQVLCYFSLKYANIYRSEPYIRTARSINRIMIHTKVGGGEKVGVLKANREKIGPRESRGERDHVSERVQVPGGSPGPGKTHGWKSQGLPPFRHAHQPEGAPLCEEGRERMRIFIKFPPPSSKRIRSTSGFSPHRSPCMSMRPVSIRRSRVLPGFGRTSLRASGSVGWLSMYRSGKGLQ